MSDIRGFGIGRVEFKKDWEEDTLAITLDGIPVVTLERYQQDDLVRAINDGHNFEYGGDDIFRRFTIFRVTPQWSNERIMHIGTYSIETSATALAALRRLCHHRRNISWRVLISDVPGARRLMEEGETEIPISFEEERFTPEDVLHEREVEKLKEKVKKLQEGVPNTPEGDAYRVGRKFYLQYAQPTVIQLKCGKELVLGLNKEEIKDVKEQLANVSQPYPFITAGDAIIATSTISSIQFGNEETSNIEEYRRKTDAGR